jgi:uracil-DNA glycosylase
MATLFDPPGERPPAPVPEDPDPTALREAVQTCRACELWEGATQAVMGEGAQSARLMFVGEQPGDREDRKGQPFVGPAGAVLDEGLREAGILREDVYITNAVKHFRYKLRGKRRIHQTPERVHVAACFPWLEAELAVVAPEALVCLGATAAKALLGPSVRIGRDRGQEIPSDLAPHVGITAHPSSILRAQDERETAMAEFVADLREVAGWLSAK